jgi:hypothetical protein
MAMQNTREQREMELWDFVRTTGFQGFTPAEIEAGLQTILALEFGIPHELHEQR